ncbi:MAG: hypothetical protein HDQ98_17610 [Lachnospiraceae bacterium]|nr:hypothetical protein [Lachnospiraceae bacterium]
MKLNLKPLPEGYSVSERSYARVLLKGDYEIARISYYNPPRFDNENFVMAIFASADYEALSAFYGNYLREQRARKQRGKGI